MRYAYFTDTQPGGLYKRSSINLFTKKGRQKRKNCFYEYHSNNLFGLSHEDIKPHGKRNKDWKAPTVLGKMSNKNLIWTIKYDNLE